MGNFFRSFTFKIWLPFTVALLVILAISAWYYPKKQEQFLIENKSGQILELAKTVSKSYELAFTDANEGQVLMRVKEIIDFVKKDHDIDFIEIHEPPNEPIRYSKDDKLIDKSEIDTDYLFQDSKFEYVSNNGQTVVGFVRIAVLKKGIEKEISKLNRPIYYILFGIALFFSVAFYFLAGWISKPLIQLTHSAKALSKQDFSIDLPVSNSDDEIGSLIKSINELKDNLIEQKTKNDKFVFGLEELVDQRAKELKVTESQLLLAQRNANFGTYKYVYKTDSFSASEVFDEIVGIDENYTRNLEELTNLFITPNERGLNVILEDLIAKNKVHFSGDFKIKRKSKGNWVFLNHVFEIRYEKKKAIEVIGSVQDITERIRFQEEVERLSHVATKTTNLVIITDEKEKIVWVNDAAVRMTEYSREEIIGNTPRMFQFEETDPETLLLIRERLGRNEVISEVEILNISKTGKKYWLSLNIVPIKNNEAKVTGYIAIESDITEQKKQLDLIAQNEKNYRNLLDTSSEMIHTLDVKGLINYANNAWLHNMGYTNLDEVKGKAIFEFFTDDTLKEFTLVMPKLMKGEVVEELKCEFIAKNGEVVNITGRSKPVLINGEFCGTEAYLFNITSVLKSENELKNMSEFQHLLMEISTKYINAPISEINELINQSLADIAAFSSADRAYVFKYNYIDEICSITHEWVGVGIPSQIKTLTAMPFSDVPYSLSKHKKGDFVEFTDVSKVKDKRIHSVLSDEGIQSVISIPMMDGDVAIGFIGFDIMKTKRVFNINEKNLMRLYSQMMVNVINRMKFIEELQSTKEALSNINVSLEKKVLENTKKNIDLSRSILEQEKLVTIGEISSGIAHDLNTPLGTIRVGSDNVVYILDKLLRDNLSECSREELIEILEYVKRNKIEIYVGGLQIRKEKSELATFLTEKYTDRSNDEILKYVDLLVKCRFDKSQEKLIDDFINRKNGIQYLEVLSQVQMAMAQLDTIKTSSDKAVRVVQDMRAFIKGETTVERKMINLRENISTVLGVFNYEINLDVDLRFEVDNSIEVMGYDIKLFQLWSNLVKNGLEAMADQENPVSVVSAPQTRKTGPWQSPRWFWRW